MFETEGLDLGRVGQRVTMRGFGESVQTPPAVIPELNRRYESPKRVPFGGSLTNKILGGMLGADFSRLLPYLEYVSLEPRQQLNCFGDRIDFVYFPETAIISHIYLLGDGSSAAASIVGRDGMVGLSAIFDSTPASYWMEVTLAGTALRVCPEVIKREFCGGGSLQQLVLDYISARLAQVSQRAVCNGCHELSQRLATWLLTIQDRAQLDELPLTQEMMANHLGTRRATVNAACTALRTSGIVSYRRAAITIIDRRRLESAACECYRVSVNPRHLPNWSEHQMRSR